MPPACRASPAPSHIVPVFVGEAELCRQVARRLLAEHNLYATPINYPTVPRGTERLRLCATPFHTDAMIAELIGALQAVLPRAGDAAGGGIAARRGRAAARSHQ